MNELLELKHRIDNCTDDLQSFELRKIYDKLIIDLWQSEKITLSEMQSMALLSSSRGRGVRPELTSSKFQNLPSLITSSHLISDRELLTSRMGGDALTFFLKSIIF